jgi:methionyl-tRNA formyltransferase
MTPIRVVYFGTAEIAVPSLRALASAAAFQVVGVVTQPDRPRGRDLRVQPSAVKSAALELALNVMQPARCRHESFLSELAALKPDLIVVAAYGQILPQSLLDIPLHGCLNIHASILPRHRGAAPIQWAIAEGDPETGVTIMKMDAGLDTGSILAIQTTPIHGEDTAQSVHDRLGTLGASLLLRVVEDYVAGRLKPQPQPAEGVTYARKIAKADGLIDWSLSAVQLFNRVRAFHPWPGAFTSISGSSGAVTIKVWRCGVEPGHEGPPGMVLDAGPEGILVACGSGALRVIELQREGGRRMLAREFLLGMPLVPGTRLRTG